MTNKINKNLQSSLITQSIFSLILKLKFMGIYDQLPKYSYEYNREENFFMTYNWKHTNDKVLEIKHGLINFKCRHIYHDIEISINTRENKTSTIMIDIIMDKEKIIDWIKRSF